MPHLLQIHIGPVQTFIAAARRSQDLWFGSWLLSELSKAAAAGIARNDPAGIEALIFPAPEALADLKGGSDLTVANKIVALVSNDPGRLAGMARDSVRDRLEEVRQATFDHRLSLAKAEEDTAQAQIEGSREFYWVAVPVVDGNYREARTLADALLAARKSTRNFSEVTWGNNRPKSSLDGAMESVIPAAISGNAVEMYTRFRARPGEQLSGIDLLKRRGRQVKGREEHFPSTSHMAAQPLATQLREKEAEVRASWQAYLDTLPADVLANEQAYLLGLPLLDDLDGSLLFTSRLTDYFDDAHKVQRETAAAALSRFYRADPKTGKPAVDEPDPYYALLAGDGDFMGETISHLDTPEKNRDFSRALAAFAGKAREIIAEHQGATIYAGGDDVLALLPLHTALPCAVEVAESFRDAMLPYGWACKPPSNTNDSQTREADGTQKPAADRFPTFSAGLAIVHHLEPLEDALALARDAERRAKDFPGKKTELPEDPTNLAGTTKQKSAIKLPGKNALAITLDKRSGAPRRVVGHWSASDDPLGGLDGRLLSLIALHQAGAIPDRLAYQLRDTYLQLAGESEDPENPNESEEERERQKEILKEILRKEAIRIINRKHSAGGAGEVADKNREQLVQMLSVINDARAFADELVIAAHLAKVHALASSHPSAEAVPEVAS